MREKKGFLLQTVQQMNAGAIVSGLGFLLYLALSALGQETAADIAGEPVLEGVAVEALEHHLTQLQQDDFVHGICSFPVHSRPL